MGVFDPDKHDNLLGITDLDHLNELETMGIMRAERFILELETNFVFDNKLILDIHYLVFGNLYEWAGKWRNIGTNIGIEPRNIPYAVIEYADQVNFLKSNITSKEDLIHCLFYTHHRYTQIHPFNNGNGRTARLFTDLITNINGYENIQLYIKENGEERQKYKAALRAADGYDDRMLKQMIGNKLTPL